MKNETLAQREIERQFVVVARDGQFWTGSSWSAEYPNAETFDSAKAAKAAARSAAGPARDVIRGYGTDKEDVIEAFPAKTQDAPKCVVCGRDAYWTVNWLIPQRKDDERLVCGANCAVKASR